MDYFWLGLVGGAAAFAHCLGMCGGFALHLAHGANRRMLFARQLLWHAGRVTTYVFLGALAGFAGGFVASFSHMAWLQNVLSFAVGGVMILMAVSLLGFLPWRRADVGTGDGILASIFRLFFREPSCGGALMLGLMTGLLPCPIIVGFLALAVQSGSVAAGMLTMAAVGLGTVWSLLLVGLTGSVIARRMPRWGAVVGAIILVLLGVVTILRGTDTFHWFLGCPASVQTEHSCCQE